MLTVDGVITFCEHELARLQLNGNAEQLRRLQLALGVLVQAAEASADRDTALRLRVLAARAADARDGLLESDE